MSLGHPHTLWLLALSIPILLVHLYRGRIRRLAVPSLWLWDQVLIEEERRSALRRLRHHASLLMMLAALALAVSAMADPTVPGVTPDVEDVALVIDTAPELQAREPDGRPRIESARMAARTLVERLPRRSRVALFDAEGLDCPLTADRERIFRALDSLVPAFHARNAEGVMRTAREAAPDALLCVYTARPCTPLDDRTRVIPVGSPDANRRLAGVADDDGRIQLTLSNDGDQPVEASLVFRDRGRPFADETVALAPRETRTIERRLTDSKQFPRFAAGPEGALLEIILQPPDRFPEDDAVHFALAPLEPPIVVVVSQGTPDAHLWNALRAMGSRLAAIPLARLDEVREKAGPDAVFVFDRVAPAALPPVACLLVGCGDLGPEIAAPKLADWDRRHPVLENVDCSEVVLRRARLTLTGTPLVSSDRGPVISWDRSSIHARLQTGFGFDVADGDFALKPPFPIFLRNAVTWLARDARRAFPRRAETGRIVPAALPLPETAAEVSMTTVFGDETRIERFPVEKGDARLAISHPGLIRASFGSRTEWLAATLPGSPDLEHLPQESGAPYPRSIPWWRDLPYPAVAATLILALLLVEWALYQRGKI